MQAPTPTDIRERIATLMADQLKVDRTSLLAGVPFAELSSDFDSLSLLEAQLLIEKAFGFELEWPTGPDATVPATLDQLAAEVARQHASKEVTHRIAT